MQYYFSLHKNFKCTQTGGRNKSIGCPADKTTTTTTKVLIVFVSGNIFIKTQKERKRERERETLCGGGEVCETLLQWIVLDFETAAHILFAH